MKHVASDLPSAVTPLGGTPTYLRVVVTTRCNWQCTFCHAEGDRWTKASHEQQVDETAALVRTALELGVRKVKFLGGEPLLWKPLDEVVARTRALDPEVDLSVITAGNVPARRVDELYAAGLSRINVSIHGYSPLTILRATRAKGAWERRSGFVERVLAHGRPVKFNYVYTGPEVLTDLAMLLSWARGRGAVINVLDDLSSDIGVDGVRGAVRSLLGAPPRVFAELDPDSLPTERWDYGDLVVELKNHRLGDVAPWRACRACPVRARCGEGIHAMRLKHDGTVGACMDRPDLSLDVAHVLRTEGADVARERWRQWLATT